MEDYEEHLHGLRVTDHELQGPQFGSSLESFVAWYTLIFLSTLNWQLYNKKEQNIPKDPQKLQL